MNNNYSDVKQGIIDALLGREAGTKIQPEKHQNYELDFLEYVRSIEIASNSCLIGYAEPDTDPVQPSASNVSYISSIGLAETITFINFIDKNGLPITITSAEDEALFITLIWNTEFWSYNTTPTFNRSVDMTTKVIGTYGVPSYNDWSEMKALGNYEFIDSELSINRPHSFLAPTQTNSYKVYTWGAVDDPVSFIVKGNKFWYGKSNIMFDRILYPTTSDEHLVSDINATQVKIEYSQDGETEWHEIPDDLDIYARFSTDNGETWGSRVKFQGTSGSGIISSDIQVNLSNGKTFGKYISGSIIPATGKTAEQVIRMAALEAIDPSVSISISGVIPYNSTSGNINITMSCASNTPGETITGFVLSYRRGSGAWIELYSGATENSRVHDVSSLLEIDNINNFSYKLTVTDSLNNSVTAVSNVLTPAAYSPPTCNILVSGTREIGNISTALIGSIQQSVQNGVSITYRKLQYSLNNLAWVDIESGTLTNSINYTHNDASLINSTVIYYRLVVVCATASGNQTANLSLGNINFVYKNAFGYNSSSDPSLSTLLSMGNNALTNSKSKTVTATAPAANFAYYIYNAAAGDLSSIIMDGVLPVLGSFTKISDKLDVNSYGASVTYRVYKSNAPSAFSNNSLVIT